MDIVARCSEIPADLWEFFEPIPGQDNLPDTWRIAAEPLSEKHYAAFPTELVRLCLKAGTSEKGYCRECGKPWARVVEEWQEPKCRNVNPDKYAGGADGENAGTWTAAYEEQTRRQSETLGWRPTCSHETEPRPALVLDPFAGSGRTGVTAQRMFLDFVGCELNPEYARMSQRILRDDCPLFSDLA